MFRVEPVTFVGSVLSSPSLFKERHHGGRMMIATGGSTFGGAHSADVCV